MTFKYLPVSCSGRVWEGGGPRRGRGSLGARSGNGRHGGGCLSRCAYPVDDGQLFWSWGVGFRVGPLAWPFPVGGVGLREGGPNRGVWSAGPRCIGRGVVLPGTSLGLPQTPGRLP